MITNRVIESKAPSLQKVQAMITSTIEHFRTKGYVVPSELERMPNADCFEVAERYARPSDLYNHTRDITVYRPKQSVPNKPVQEFASFKQYENETTYSVTSKVHYNEGQQVREVFDSGDPNHPYKLLKELKYDGNSNKVIQETEFVTLGNHTFKTVKTINPNTGYYTKETIFPGIKPYPRKIGHYNNHDQKIMTTEIYSPNNVVKTKLDPKTGNPTEIMNEDIYSGGGKLVRECKIDPNTGKISSYKRMFDGEICAQFERNSLGQVTYCKDTWGNEFRYDEATGKATLKSDKYGTELECSSNKGNDLIKECAVSVDMEKYL